MAETMRSRPPSQERVSSPDIRPTAENVSKYKALQSHASPTTQQVPLTHSQLLESLKKKHEFDDILADIVPNDVKIQRQRGRLRTREDKRRRRREVSTPTQLVVHNRNAFVVPTFLLPPSPNSHPLQSPLHSFAPRRGFAQKKLRSQSPPYNVRSFSPPYDRRSVSPPLPPSSRGRSPSSSLSRERASTAKHGDRTRQPMEGSISELGPTALSVYELGDSNYESLDGYSSGEFSDSLEFSSGEYAASIASKGEAGSSIGEKGGGTHSSLTAP